jgi:hypothetical protein
VVTVPVAPARVEHVVVTPAVLELDPVDPWKHCDRSRVGRDRCRRLLSEAEAKYGPEKANTMREKGGW